MNKLIEDAGDTFPVSQGPLSDIARSRLADGFRKRRCVLTMRFAERLTIVASSSALTEAEQRRLLAVAAKLVRCATDQYGYRCAHAICPRCRARKAKRHNRPALERRLRALPLGTKLVHITATVATDSIADGYIGLTRSMARLRKTKAWRRNFVGGEFHVDVKKSSGRMCRWNVHAHGIVQMNQGAKVDDRWFAVRWSELLKSLGRVGRLDIEPVQSLWGGH